MKIFTVVGARPQFIKAATVSRAIRENNAEVARTSRGTAISELICHTGQHFDANMSKVFFDQLDIPTPDHHLGISGLGHGGMTGRMLEGIESLLRTVRPDWVLVYGDTNSTLAAALAASKLHIPIAHIEAGLRSHNPLMPEEINRVLTDRVSTLLLCPTETAVSNLQREGFPFPAPVSPSLSAHHSQKRGSPAAGWVQRIENIGDVMFDAVLHYRGLAQERVELESFGVTEQSYALCTLHRQENTDDPARLESILSALRRISLELPVLIPLHPRTRARLAEESSGEALKGLTLLDPLPYLEMQRLQMSARVILTDSGGIQKEAYFHRVPCITLRDETEWVETVESGWNQLAGAIEEKIVAASKMANAPSDETAALYGDGKAAFKVLQNLIACSGPAVSR
jgi:UDP-GlcNAc3NAcA epimerase